MLYTITNTILRAARFLIVRRTILLGYSMAAPPAGHSTGRPPAPRGMGGRPSCRWQCFGPTHGRGLVLAGTCRRVGLLAAGAGGEHTAAKGGGRGSWQDAAGKAARATGTFAATVSTASARRTTCPQLHQGVSGCQVLLRAFRTTACRGVPLTSKHAVAKRRLCSWGTSRQTNRPGGARGAGAVADDAAGDRQGTRG